MDIAPITQAAPPMAPQLPSFRSPARGEVALVDLPGSGFLSIQDTLTGYGRAQGYDSLANARRAAYMLSVGETSPAAGIFQQGDRYFVRALGGLAARSPHADASRAPLQLLHFEGNAAAHFAWVRDPRLVMIVDGVTKIWTRDAHHQPPTA